MDSISKKIKTILIDKDLKQKDVYTKIGMEKGNFSRLLSKDDFIPKALKDIAETLNCDIEVKLIDRDTKKEY